jgi:hypothetical protein
MIEFPDGWRSWHIDIDSGRRGREWAWRFPKNRTDIDLEWADTATVTGQWLTQRAEDLLDRITTADERRLPTGVRMRWRISHDAADCLRRARPSAAAPHLFYGIPVTTDESAASGTLELIITDRLPT